MKSKKMHQTTVHDLRDIDPVRIAVPDVSGKLAGVETSSGTEQARIVTPGRRCPDARPNDA